MGREFAISCVRREGAFHKSVLIVIFVADRRRDVTQFIATDFFDEQPVLPGEPGVFLLRNITHDWSDKYAVKILRQLRDAAIPSTKLVLISCITDYACRLPDDEAEAPPAPLLANLGGANIFPYSFDLAVCELL